MRYYAEWLDGEYVLLNRAHSAISQRALRFHALLGSTIVLSDAQMVDCRNSIPTMFADRGFRSFLHQNPHFLALVAAPAKDIKDRNLAIAIKGIERIRDQARKPADSYEAAVYRLGKPILKKASF